MTKKMTTASFLKKLFVEGTLKGTYTETLREVGQAAARGMAKDLDDDEEDAEVVETTGEEI